MRISDWSSDVCSSDLTFPALDVMKVKFAGTRHLTEKMLPLMAEGSAIVSISSNGGLVWSRRIPERMEAIGQQGFDAFLKWCEAKPDRSEENTSELQSVMLKQYGVFCVTKKYIHTTD